LTDSAVNWQSLQLILLVAILRGQRVRIIVWKWSVAHSQIWNSFTDGLCRTNRKHTIKMQQNMSYLSPVTKNWWHGWRPVSISLLAVTSLTTLLTTGSVACVLL